MAEPIISPSGTCCSNCGDSIVQNIPGPKGDTGAAGSNGTDGTDAYTFTSTTFAMPAVNSTVSISVLNSEWATIGQYIFIQSAGTLKITAKADSTHLTVENLGYSGNAAPTTVIASSSSVSPGGQIGATGASGVGSTLNSLSPTTTRGDLIVDNGANNPLASDVRFGVGSNYKIIHADSGQSAGLRWDVLDLTGTNTSLSGALAITKGGTGQITRQAALNALAPTSPATGDLLTFDGTNWVRLARGTANQLLATNSGGTDIGWASGATPIAQMKDSSTNAFTTTTASIPFDDTIPLSTEGTQILTVSITPKTITNKLVIEAFIPCSAASSDKIVVAIFSGTTCIAASAFEVFNNGGVIYQNMTSITHEFVPGSISALTIGLNIGTATGVSLSINGINGTGRKFGGVQFCWLRVTEFVV